MTKDEAFGATFHDNPFTRREALNAGFSDVELHRSGFPRPFQGVRMHQTADDLVTLTRAYATKIAPDRAFTGWSAAALRGWPIPKRLQNSLIVEVAGPRARGRVRERGVDFQRVRDDLWSTATFDGMPLTSAPLTLLGLAKTCSLTELITIGDAAVATSKNYQNLRERGATSTAELRHAVETFSGCHGARRLRQAVARIRAGVESRLESLARIEIVDADLPEPEVGVEIWDRGELLAIADLMFRRHRVIVEYEGKHHFTDPAQAKKDLRRVRLLNELGWHVMRITVEDLFPSPVKFTDELRRVLARAAT